MLSRSTRVFAHSQDIIKRLVEQARLTHQARDQGKIVVYTPSRKNWLRSAARPPRKLDSVVLPRGVKEGLVDDMTDFFDAEEWYFDRGERVPEFEIDMTVLTPTLQESHIGEVTFSTVYQVAEKHRLSLHSPGDCRSTSA